MNRFFTWLLSSSAGFYLNLFVLGLLTTGAFAATSYDVTNEPQMNLDVSITSSQTTGIRIASPQRNGTDHIFTAMTGGVLRIRWGSYQEDIYYSLATRNTSTNTVTLTGTVLRNLCPYSTRTYTSCGNGRNWGKGAIVELNQDARLFNLKANVDRANVFTASGGVTFSGSGSFRVPNYANTTERDRQNPNPRDGQLAYHVASGSFIQRVGSAWLAVGSATTPNATEAVAGKVELPTLAELQNRTATGSTGAPTVLSLNWLVKNGTGTTTAGRIPQLNINGVLSATLGGTGVRNPSSGGVLIAQGSGAMKTVAGTTSGNVLRYNGGTKNWESQSLSACQLLYANTASAADVGANDTAEFNFDKTYSLAANALNAGDLIHIRGAGRWVSDSGNVTFRVKMGSTAHVLVFTGASAGNLAKTFTFDTAVHVRTVGAAGTLLPQSSVPISGSGTQVFASSTTRTMDTTASNTIQVSAQFSAARAAAAASLYNFSITRCR